MYRVDTVRIEAILKHLEKSWAAFEAWQAIEAPLTVKQLALERLLHISIESVTDVGNLLIDGFIMRDPGSYEDIIDILEDEKVIDREMSLRLKEMVGCRQPLLKAYTTLSYDWVEANTFRFKDVLRDFPEAVRVYLQRELP